MILWGFLQRLLHTGLCDQNKRVSRAGLVLALVASVADGILEHLAERLLREKYGGGGSVKTTGETLEGTTGDESEVTRECASLGKMSDEHVKSLSRKNA